MKKLMIIAAGLLLSAGVATYAVSKTNNKPASICNTTSCDVNDCSQDCCCPLCCTCE